MLVVRALLFRPHGMRCKASFAFARDVERAGESLSKMVSFKTVSHPNQEEDDNEEDEWNH